ncbi:hypothetical protein AB1046_16645 [Promicromonospora sp. Populi]|uniref:hypothetical protein n=1 Tax=Promicromonospora sp. Populi TaxID=3239420 RepID=UPI0034E26A27
MPEILRSSCDNGTTCPTIHRADDGAFIVQGYQTASHGTVRIPVWLATEWDSPARRHGDDLLVAGQLVTDPSILAYLDLPVGEAAVIVRPADVPALGVSSC